MYEDLVIECDRCGRAFYGAGLDRVIVRQQDGEITCVKCLVDEFDRRKLARTRDASYRMASPAEANEKVAQGGA